MRSFISGFFGVVFVVSLICTLVCFVEDMRVGGWYKTTLTITFIGLPDGAVYGDYVDEGGEKHSNELAFRNDIPLSKYRNDSEKYYGDIVKIAIDPQTGKIVNYDSLLRNNIIFVGFTFLSGIVVLAARKSS